MLPDGNMTVPDTTLIKDTERFRSLVRVLEATFPARDPGTIRIADLGCMEGGYSLEMARMGYRVVGIEGRITHFKRCQFLKDTFRFENLEFIQCLVQDTCWQNMYDVVYASGILYHLDSPVEFLMRIGKMTRKLLLLNTHYSGEQKPSRFRHKLSAQTTHEGKRGRWYEEWPTDTKPEEVEKMSRSSISNHRSFWLRKDSLLETVREAGFDLVFEQYDCHYDMAKALQAIHRNARGMFVAVKS
jgi:SAM-dependent methyltransferase